MKFWKSTRTPSPKVGVALRVWGFTPSYSFTFFYTPRSLWCDFWVSFRPTPLRFFCLNSRVSFWPATLWLLCLGRELKANRVATNVIVVIMTVFFFCQRFNFLILKHYPYDGFVTICCWCFKNVINSIHKTIICCIISST